jgi:hypothetical protein
MSLLHAVEQAPAPKCGAECGRRDSFSSHRHSYLQTRRTNAPPLVPLRVAWAYDIEDTESDRSVIGEVATGSIACNVFLVSSLAKVPCRQRSPSKRRVAFRSSREASVDTSLVLPPAPPGRDAAGSPSKHMEFDRRRYCMTAAVPGLEAATLPRLSKLQTVRSQLHRMCGATSSEPAKEYAAISNPVS